MDVNSLQNLLIPNKSYFSDQLYLSTRLNIDIVISILSTKLHSVVNYERITITIFQRKSEIGNFCFGLDIRSEFYTFSTARGRFSRKAFTPAILCLNGALFRAWMMLIYNLGPVLWFAKDFKNNKQLSSSFEAWKLHCEKIQYEGSNTLV